MENISPNISYLDSIKSTTAIRYGIENIPSDTELTSMKELAMSCYEPIVKHFGYKIPFASFFRCKELNKRIGGADNSQHTKGEAIDLDADGTKITNNELYYWIKDNLIFDQVIKEYPDKNGNPSWIHVSFRKGANRNESLIAKKQNGKTVYVKDPL
jgi:zinc D-Ala-D-Ala carboxypeptidase